MTYAKAQKAFWLYVKVLMTAYVLTMCVAVIWPDFVEYQYESSRDE